MEKVMRTRIASIVFMGLSVLKCSLTAQLSWEFTNGPYYANVEDFAVGSINGQVTLYAADSAAVQTVDAFVLKSTNRGESWEHKRLSNVSGTVNCVATFRSNPDVLYVGIPLMGVYKSMDGGTTWNPAASIPNPRIARIAVHPNDPNIVWVGCKKTGPFTYHPVLYRSTNGGAEWIAMNIGGVPPNTHRLSVSDITVAGDTVFLSTYGGTGQNEGVWRTRNAGTDWTREITGMNTDNLNFASIVVDPNNPNVLYSGNSEGNVRRLYKTTDGTMNCAWNSVLTAPQSALFTDIRVSPLSGNSAFATVRSSPSHVVRTTDGGLNWTTLDIPAHIDRLEAVEIDPTDAQKIFIGGFGACYRSDDNGNNWQEKNIGTLVAPVNALAKSAMRIYSSGLTPNGTIFRSTTGGSDWLVSYSVDESIHIDLAIDPMNNLNAVASGAMNVEFPAVFITEDGSQNWTIREVNPSQPCEPSAVVSVALGNNGIEEIYTATSKTNTLECIQVAKSTNRGISWILLLDRPFRTLKSLQVSGPLIYAGGGNTSGASVFKSVDFGQNWTELENGLPAGASVTALFLSPFDQAKVFAGTTSGMYRTTDGGGNWSAINNGIQYPRIQSVVGHPLTPSVVYASSNEINGTPHFYRTADGGGTWIEMNSPQARINDLTIDPTNPNSIYAATNAGVYHIAHRWTGALATSATWQTGSEYLVEGTLTVPSGVTLTIQQGAIVKFMQNAELKVDGQLTAVGTSNSRITFTSLNTGETWKGIAFGTTSGSQVLYANITNADKAIYARHNIGLSVSDCFITGGTIGVHLFSSGGGGAPTSITGNTITGAASQAILFSNGTSMALGQNNVVQGPTTYGIYFVNTSPVQVTGNKVSGVEKDGFYLFKSSPSLVNTIVGGQNCSYSNDVGVKATTFSNPVLGRVLSSESGMNTFTINLSYQIVLEDNCEVYAEDNFWGPNGPNPGTDFLIDQTSTLYYDPFLTGTDPNGCTSGAAPMAIGNEGKGDEENVSTSPLDDPRAREALRMRTRRRHNEAMGILRSIIASPQSAETLIRWAMNELIANYQALNPPSSANRLSQYFRTLLHSRSNAETKRTIRDAIASTYLHEGDAAGTLAALDETIRQHPNTSSEALALYSKVDFALNVANDIALAQSALNALTTGYARHELTRLAEVLVGLRRNEQRTAPTSSKISAAAMLASPTTPRAYSVEQNYPNPFNPTTTIRFAIPQKEHVTLKVYDLLGREVATLVNEARSAGSYDETFDASKLASGMYIYKLQAGNFTASRKFVLMK
jgi:photosystem II stability/assembly factor-like uncharacterized protein